MDCPKCGAINGSAKRTCYKCGAILSGYTINNVTGEYGYRNPDGTFTKEPKLAVDIDRVYIKSEGSMSARILTPQPIGHLEHAPTGYSLAVYKPISRFKAFMLKWCFGLKFVKYGMERKG